MPPRLLELWTPYAGDASAAREEWTALIERWSEPHRGYHNLEHLLLMLELLAAQDAEPATMLAAWYHDAVYEPTSATNEADSADLAREALTRLSGGVRWTTPARHGSGPPADADSAGGELADRVAALVLMTADHHAPDGDEQATLLLDADLAILGQPPAIYLRYVEGVRREYAHVSDDDFRKGRSEILRDLLGRERLYQHRAFASLEQPARANLAAELQVYGLPLDTSEATATEDAADAGKTSGTGESTGPGETVG